jgi:hypothetical protein
MASNNNTYEQVYNSSEDGSFLSRLDEVICVLVQRGVMVAGFTDAKELLTIHYTGYNKNRPVWALDFFEQLFANEPLLAMGNKVKGVFICSDKHLVVPDALYDEQEAVNWLKKIHFIEPGDEILSRHMESDKVNYQYAVPVNITELIKINFSKAVTLPLPVYHFKNVQREGLQLQCCITGEQVCATMHNNGQLLWHRIFHYTCAEDIAYDINHLSIENNITASNITFLCNSISASEYKVLNDLSQYFPSIRSGSGNNIASEWDPAISLAQQLIACV